MICLTACGSASTISVSAVAKCAKAEHERYTSIPPHDPSYGEVAAKTVKGGWLIQSFHIGEDHPTFSLYIFKNDKTAEEAFNIISTAPDAHEEWGGGGTWRRQNLIITTSGGEPGSLPVAAETLLQKCAGTGTSQSVLRTQESASTNTDTGEAIAPAPTPEPAPEAPDSEDRPNPGQSPIPGEGE